MALNVSVQPSNVTVTEPAAAEFTVTGAGNTGTILYEWYDREPAPTAAVTPQEVDQYFEDVVSLLHFDTDRTDDGFGGDIWVSDSEVNTTITDGQLVHSGASTTPLESTNAGIWDCRTDFTFECLYTPTSSSGEEPILTLGKINATNTRSGIYRRTSTGAVRVLVENAAGTSVCDFTCTTPLLGGTQYHIAWVRNGGNSYIFIDGVQDGTGTWSDTTNYTAYKARLGEAYIGSTLYYADAKFDEVRWTQGVVRYTGTFTPRTTAFPTWEPDRYVDYVSLYSKMVDSFDSALGGARVWTEVNTTAEVSGGVFDDEYYSYDGTGDYAHTPHTADLRADTDFTIEGWFNGTSFRAGGTGYNAIACKRLGGGVTDTSDYNIWVNGGNLRLFVAQTGGSASVNIVGGTTVTTGVWHHFAAVRTGTSWELFLDGVSEGTATEAGTLNYKTGPLYIGRDNSVTTRDFHGGIGHIRVTYGIARYATRYRIPTEAFPLTRFTAGLEPTILDDKWLNTIAVLNFDSDFSDAKGNTWSTVATAPTIDTTTKLYGAGSASFGTSGYLKSTDLPALGDDFTLEFSVNATAPADWSNIFDNRQTQPGSTGMGVYWNASTTALLIQIGGSNLFTGTIATRGSVWVDVAIIRESGVYYVYVDGVQEVATISNSTTHPQPAIGTTIGGSQFFANSHSLMGNADNFRITTASRRTGYTNPTAAFPEQEYDPDEILTAATYPGRITGETTDTLTIDPTSVSQTGNTYYARLYDDLTAVNSTGATLTVNAAGPEPEPEPDPLLYFDTQPQAAEKISGASVTFGPVSVANDVGTVTYQWYSSAAGLLTGETATSLTFTTGDADNGRSYWVVATDDNGSQASTHAALTVWPVLTIVTQPAAATPNAGDLVTWTVSATGDSLTYQWYAAGELLTGETARSISRVATPERSGTNYYVIVQSSGSQSVQSDNVAMTVTVPAPVVGTIPAQSGTVDGSVTFKVEASGYRGLTYQWSEDTAGAISGATGKTLTLEALTLADSANAYYCTVSDAYSGSTQSNSAILTVTDRGSLVDSTDPIVKEGGHTMPNVSHTSQNYVGLVKAAEAGQPRYYDEYRFSGKTFRKRNKTTNERS